MNLLYPTTAIFLSYKCIFARKQMLISTLLFLKSSSSEFAMQKNFSIAKYAYDMIKISNINSRYEDYFKFV